MTTYWTSQYREGLSEPKIVGGKANLAILNLYNPMANHLKITKREMVRKILRSLIVN